MKHLHYRRFRFYCWKLVSLLILHWLVEKNLSIDSKNQNWYAQYSIGPFFYYPYTRVYSEDCVLNIWGECVSSSKTMLLHSLYAIFRFDLYVHLIRVRFFLVPCYHKKIMKLSFYLINHNQNELEVRENKWARWIEKGKNPKKIHHVIAVEK